MAAFLAVPSKHSAEQDLVRPIKNFIQNTYSSDGEGEDYSQQVNELNKLRINAVCRKLDKHANSLDTLIRYYDQLEAIDGKLPICEGQITINLCWLDAFDKGSLFSGGRKQTMQSSGFEKCCTLFNIGAMHSQIGALQNPEDDDGLKTAAKHFQAAAGIFNHLKDNIVSIVQNIRTFDLHPDCLQALGALMLAQAQESFMRKARQDNMKNAIIAKLAMTASDLYTEALKRCQVAHVKEVIPKDWLPTLAGKQAYMHCLAEFYQSMVCKDSKSYGEEIARLTHASDLCKAAVTRAGQTMNFKDIQGKVQRALDSAKKDNDFIYHDVVPKTDGLSGIGSAPLAKPTELSKPMNPNFQDMFEKLNPLTVLNAMAAYEARKVEIVSREIGKLRESTQLMNSVLSSLNLPASIEDLGGDTIPSSILGKSREIQAKGGLLAIEKLFADLPELLQRNTEILNVSFKELDEEAEGDKQMRERFKERWSRLPSDQLTSPLRTEGGKYRAILNNAMEADGKVREKFNTNREFIAILSKSEGELAAALPPSSAGAALANTPVVQELRGLIESTNTIKNEREVTESEIKNTTCDMRSKFLSALAADGVINEEALSNTNLDEMYAPLIQQVGDSLRRQEGILNNIQDANTRFSAAKQTDTSAQQREDVQRKMAGAYDSYMELTANLLEGTKFYNDLTQLLVKFQSKVSDLCFARRTEKEELLRDLTQSIANQPSGPPPTTPTHHTPAPARPPPPRTTQPSAAAATAPPPAGPSGYTTPPGYGQVPAQGPPPGAPQYQNPPPAGQQPGGYPTQQYQPMPSYAPSYGGYAPQPYNPYAAPVPPPQQQPYPQQQYQYPPQQGYPGAPGAPYGQQPPSYNPYQQQQPPR